MNSFKKGNTGCIQAFTMPELLVYIVIAGIIFLLITEGFGLFRRYAENRAESIVGNMEFYDGYHRLASVCNAADSIASDNYDRIRLFAGGELNCELYKDGTALVIIRGESVDTLFSITSELAHKEKVPNTPGDDSLAVVLSSLDSSLRISFAVKRRPERLSRETVEEKEKDYKYE